MGQEKDGSILIGWVEESKKNNVLVSCTVVGRYDQINNKLQVGTAKLNFSRIDRLNITHTL